MKYLIVSLFIFTGCATKSKSALNCEKLHADSVSRLEELRHILESYQNINYDLAVKLSPPLKEEVSDLDSRIKKQKQRCWASEKRPIDSDMALLKDELFKVYGKENDLVPLKTAKNKESEVEPSRQPASQKSTNDFVESVELDE